MLIPPIALVLINRIVKSRGKVGPGIVVAHNLEDVHHSHSLSVIGHRHP
jgi:hypothetical protein